MMVVTDDADLKPGEPAGCNLLQDARMAEPVPTESGRSVLLVLVADGDLWVWRDGEDAVRNVPIGDAVDAWPSPDGSVVALLRRSDDDAYPGMGTQSIWRLDADGSGLRELDVR